MLAKMTISNSKFSGNTSAISNTNKLTLNNVTVDAGSGSAKMISTQPAN